MTAAVLTPFTTADAVELGNRSWWKRLLPVGEIDYKGRRLKFTRDYLAGLKHAFDDKAYDQTAFQLADAANTHTNDPERFRGEIAEMDLRDDGLWMRLSPTDAGDAVLKENPRLGVSARIVEDYARSDGKHYPAAIQHVLGTLDPRIPGLGAWQAIEAATPAPDTVLDLSASTFAGEAPLVSVTGGGSVSYTVGTGGGGGGEFSATTIHTGGSPSPAPEGTDGMPDLDALTDEQKARLAALLELPDDQIDALAAGGVVVTPEELDALAGPDDEAGAEGGTEDDGDDIASRIAAMTDEEFAALQAEFEAEAEGEPATETGTRFTPNYQPEGEPVGASLNAEAQFAIDLANARADETARELSVITARLREEDYQGEKRRMADLGVPPYITELARPLLEGAGHAVELANGKSVDAGAIMRRVLTEYARQARLLDLDVELGSPVDEPEDAGREQRDTSREDVVSRFKQMTGLK